MLTMESEISIQEFVQLLFNIFSKYGDRDKLQNNVSALLHYGHVRGWLEDQDEMMADSFLDKRTCARILHQFMVIELKIPDLENVGNAFSLKDIYTCRVCTNHVVQVFARQIMEGETMEVNGSTASFFNMTRLVSKEEAAEAIKKVREIIN